MNRRRPQLLQGRDMLRRSVALIGREAVSRVNLLVFHHHMIPGDLGNDAGRRNGHTLGVALDNGNLGNLHQRNRHCVI